MVLSVTVPLTRRQQLRLYRFRSGQWLVAMFYITRIAWPTKCITADWKARILWESGKADRS
jgi:hypothetical protein